MYEPTPTYYFRQHEEADRISGRSYAEQGLMTRYDLIQRYRRLIAEQQGEPLPAEVSTALAHALWRHGRAILREGHGEVAKEYFWGARALTDGRSPTVESVPYRVMNWLGGPVVAENVMSSVKSVGGTP